MREKRIVHQGLNAYRLIRGWSEHEVQTKAQLQLAQWEERWQNKLRIQKQREQRSYRYQNDQESKAVALERTYELEEQRRVLESLLKTACLNETPLDWEALKQSSKFPTPVPVQPKPIPLPSPPAPLDPPRVLPPVKVHVGDVIVPKFNLLEKAIPILRRNKQIEAAGLTEHYAQQAAEQNANEEAFRRTVEEARTKEESAFQRAQQDFQTQSDVIRKNNEDRKQLYFREVESWQSAKAVFEREQAMANAEVDSLREKYLAREPLAIKAYCYEILARSSYPDSFPREHFIEITSEGTLVVDFELPSLAALPAIKEVKYVASRAAFQEISVSDIWLKKTFDEVLYQMCLRTVYELFRSDGVDALKSIVFNGWVRSIDRATGSEVHACVMSLEAGKDEFLAINLMHVDPKSCFKKLKGVAASKLVELSPVKPLVLLDREDKRFVEGYAVADTLDEKTNLAAMDWLDFENLIREVFEKEFSKGGGEVKITQASRDGGVDAIAFDPDPIRGGKLVIQAKRYTNTVGVSAVRDLYGTVHNEGANKGILVTTSDFGPDAYAFAKDKPLTLICGAELLYLLAQHGHSARIDLADARRLATENAR